MPETPTRPPASDEERVGRMRWRLHALFAEAEQLGERQIRRGRNVANFVNFLRERRQQFWFVLTAFRDINPNADEDLDARYVLNAYLAERSRLIEAENRSELIEAWLDVLVVAAEKMRQDDELARRYEAEGLHADEALVSKHVGDYAAIEPRDA
jgi:hypothetical protein